VKRGELISGIGAAIIGVGAMVTCGYLLPYFGYKLLYLAFAEGHSGDPSIGDSVGWMIVFVWPGALLFVIGVSVAAGIVVFCIAFKRLSAAVAPFNKDLLP
jgi:hypothetical protein